MYCFSKLTCMHFGSWDNSKEWTIPMDDGEAIEVSIEAVHIYMYMCSMTCLVDYYLDSISKYYIFQCLYL